MGNIICPRSAAHVSTKYLQYLKDLDEVRSYSWLEAMLAYVICSFGQPCSRGGIVYLDGCAPIIMLWAFEHFHGLVPKYVSDHSSADREVPLILYWSNALHGKGNRDVADDYVSLVNNLEFSPIKVQYPDELAYLKDKVVFSLVETYFFHGASSYMYRAAACYHQFDISPCTISTPFNLKHFNLHKLSRRGPNRNWANADVQQLAAITKDIVRGEIVNKLAKPGCSIEFEMSFSPPRRMQEIDEINCQMHQPAHKDMEEINTADERPEDLEEINEVVEKPVTCSRTFGRYAKCWKPVLAGTLHCELHQPKDKDFSGCSEADDYDEHELYNDVNKHLAMVDKASKALLNRVIYLEKELASKNSELEIAHKKIDELM